MKMNLLPVAVGAAAVMLQSLPLAAADLGPYRGGGTQPSYQAPLAIERWTGFYMGAALGYSSGSSGVTGGSGDFTFDQSGGAGSVFAGYNWQLGSAIVGLEADIGTGSIDGTATSSGRNIGGEVNSFGSLRGRAGMLMTQQILLYATGGLAWANTDFKVAGADTVSNTLFGYQLGAGLEYKIAPQWTMRVEYLYTDLTPERFDHGGGLANSYDPDFHTIRAGLAFKF